MTEKICSRCKIAKSLDAFSKNRNLKDGLEYMCKTCTKEYHTERRQKRTPLIITEKKCQKCGVTKPVSEYYKDIISKDGYQCYCISCKQNHLKNLEHIEVAVKQCNKCGEIKPISEFYNDHCNIDGHINSCKKCYNEYVGQLQAREREPITEKRCHKCQEVKPISEFEKDSTRKDGYKYFCKICEAKYKRGEPMKIYQTKYQQVLKRGVLTHYCPDGILQCADPYHVHKIPETDIDVLTLDHINGGGNREIREKGSRLYPRLVKENFPSGFQVLCANCQFLKKLDKHENNGGKPFQISYFWQRQSNTRTKTETLAHYSPNGIIQCADPFHRHDKPETNIDVLCIDHINGNGYEEKRKYKNMRIYNRLKNQGYPTGYQVLCSSCNTKKRIVFKENGNRNKKVGQSI